MTGFVTDEHPDGRYTVFCTFRLSIPQPVLFLHLEKEYVHLVDVSVEETMRSIISCGAGSTQLLKKMLK